MLGTCQTATSWVWISLLLNGNNPVHALLFLPCSVHLEEMSVGTSAQDGSIEGVLALIDQMTSSFSILTKLHVSCGNIEEYLEGTYVAELEQGIIDFVQSLSNRKHARFSLCNEHFGQRHREKEASMKNRTDMRGMVRGNVLLMEWYNTLPQIC